MVTLNIDGRTICVPEGTTILDAALSAGIHIPHLCYLKGINEIGACRLCCVEVEGEDKLIPPATTWWPRAWPSTPTTPGSGWPGAPTCS